jgi:hypothetical protein
MVHNYTQVSAVTTFIESVSFLLIVITKRQLPREGATLGLRVDSTYCWKYRARGTPTTVQICT